MKSRILALLVLGALSACATQPQQTAMIAPPSQPPNEPPGINGLSAESVRTAFGEPAFVRKDSGVELWRYDGPTCRAFFFLYPNGSSHTVRHVETLPRGTAMPADLACLDALKARAKVS
jgi:hypothetical protein